MMQCVKKDAMKAIINNLAQDCCSYNGIHSGRQKIAVFLFFRCLKFRVSLFFTYFTAYNKSAIMGYYIRVLGTQDPDVHMDELMEGLISEGLSAKFAFDEGEEPGKWTVIDILQ